jgi:hypothetical protein
MRIGCSRPLLFSISVTLLVFVGACNCVDLSQATFDEDGGSLGAADAGRRDAATAGTDAQQLVPEDAAAEPEDATAGSDARWPGQDAQTRPDADVVSQSDASMFQLCTIDGSSWPAGGYDPTTPCLVCDPARSGFDWTLLPAGATCSGSSTGPGCATRTCNGSGTCLWSDNGTACSSGPSQGVCSAGTCSTNLVSAPPMLATADATIDGTNATTADTKYGGTGTLEIAPTKSTVIKFDVSPLAGRYVSTAKLGLNVTGGTLLQTRIYLLGRGFAEPAVTWNAATGTEDWALPGAKGPADHGSVVTMTTLNCSQHGQLPTEITALVQAWADDPTSNHGLLLESGSASVESCTFTSKEDGVSTNRPLLNVSFY